MHTVGVGARWFPARSTRPQPATATARAGEFKHAWRALTHIVTKEGRRGIFAGYGSFLLRDLPFDAIEVRGWVGGWVHAGGG